MNRCNYSISTHFIADVLTASSAVVKSCFIPASKNILSEANLGK